MTNKLNKVGHRRTESTNIILDYFQNSAKYVVSGPFPKFTFMLQLLITGSTPGILMVVGGT